MLVSWLCCSCGLVLGHMRRTPTCWWCGRRYSIAAGLAHHLIPVIRVGMDSWPAELQLQPQQTRALYMKSADVLRASKVGCSNVAASVRRSWTDPTC
jgi:hypothetical protein